MIINIKSSDDLNTLLDALAKEIVDANIYYRLFLDLIESRKSQNYIKEFAQSQTFWFLTISALKDTMLSHLCRVYDQEDTGLNLVNLLDTIKANLHLFEEVNFRKRLQNNAFVDSLAEYNRIPSSEQLESDILFASTNNPLVKKLIIWRNNIIAHRGAKVALGKKTILTENTLSEKDIVQLLDSSFEIFNRYSSLYRASTYSRQIVGHDDYKSVLNFLKLGLQKWDENIEKDIERIKQSSSES